MAKSAAGATSKNVAPTLADTTFKVNENGIFSGAVLASDPDKKDVIAYAFGDGKLTYVAPDGVTFLINATTGAITSSAPMNYEITSSYSFVIRATDLAGASDTGVVTIKVNDVNEVPVAFVGAGDADATANSVVEGAANGSLVGVTAIAFDGDGTRNVVTYQLVSNASGGSVVSNGAFQIDASTGVVSIRDGSLLNYENATSSTIYVKATSADGSSAVHAFTIDITDRNEFAVAFIGGGDASAAANTVAEGAAAGTLVGVTASAIDADGTHNAVSYQLVTTQGDAVTNGAFQVDATSGVVTVRDGSLINYEASATQTILVKAMSTDGSTAIQSFTINVQNVNEAHSGDVLVAGQRLSVTPDAYQLTADVSGVSDPDGIVSAQVQWQQFVNGAWQTIADKTAATVSLDASFSGALVRSAYIYLDGSGATETVYSAALQVPNVDTILGGSGNDDLYGTGVDDVVRGLAGNDILHGGAGDDLLDGGAGHDWAIYSDATGPLNVQMAAGTVTGAGIGSDTLRSVERVEGTAFADHYDATGFSGSSLNSGSDALLNVFEGMGGDDVVVGNGNTRMSYVKAAASVTLDMKAGMAYSTAPGDAAGIGVDIFSGVTQVRGSDYDDRLFGNSVINDTFEARGGADDIDGRSGFDRVGYKDESAGIDVHLAEGSVYGGDAGAGRYDTLRSIEAIQGTEFADTFDARGFSPTSINSSTYSFNNLNQSWNDFEGMGGDDVVHGNGNTMLRFVNADGGVFVDMQAGTAASIDANDAAHIGRDTFDGVNRVVGSDFNDIITGTTLSDIFEGRGGSDYLSGLGGYDFVMYTSEGLTSGINVQLASGVVTSTNGTDTLRSIEAVRGTNFSDLYDATGFTNVSANAGSNGLSNDFEGYAGNDLIIGNGATRVMYQSATTGVTVDLAAGYAIGDSSVGTDTFSGVSGARGSAYGDVILGNSGSNYLEGNNGDDILNGRGGFDTLNGGAGADTFVFDQGGPTTIQDFAAGELGGHDVIDFATTVFADYEHVMAAASQSGSSVVLTSDAGSILLNNVLLSSLVASDFHFH